VRRPPELTPVLNVLRDGGSAGPDIGVLLDPANDVAYKMIGGAYGVLGAEVLGYYVPRGLDPQRWGIYVREAGVAWLCSRVAPQVDGHPELAGELPTRLARGIATHHYVHLVVEAAVTESRGNASYLGVLVDYAPRHEPHDEILGELLFRLEVPSGLAPETRRAMETSIDTVLRQAPDKSSLSAGTEIPAVVDHVNSVLSLNMSAGDFEFRKAAAPVPQYLVLEPHLPQPVASSIRKALLG
jgi:hypothetical protein